MTEIEQQFAELQKKYDEAQASLNETRSHLERAERRAAIDAALMDAEASDLEAARLLTEAAVTQMSQPDISAAVDDLRRRKPHLFRRMSPAASVGTMSPRPRTNPAPLHDAAQQAAESGNRRDLLRYLRMRRSKPAQT